MMWSFERDFHTLPSWNATSALSDRMFSVQDLRSGPQNSHSFSSVMTVGWSVEVCQHLKDPNVTSHCCPLLDDVPIPNAVWKIYLSMFHQNYPNVGNSIYKYINRSSIHGAYDHMIIIWWFPKTGIICQIIHVSRGFSLINYPFDPTPQESPIARSPASLPVNLRRDGAGGARLCSKIYRAESRGSLWQLNFGRDCGYNMVEPAKDGVKNHVLMEAECYRTEKIVDEITCVSLLLRVWCVKEFDYNIDYTSVLKDK